MVSDVEPTRHNLNDADVETATEAIDRWLAGVGEVLRFSSQLPDFGWIEVLEERRGPNPPADAAPAPLQPSKRRFVSRRLVHLYIESHLDRRLKTLAKTLTIECMTVGQDPRSDRLRFLLASIEGLRSKRLTGRIRAWLLKLSASVAVLVVGPAVLLDGLDSEDVRRAVTAVVLLLSLPFYFLLLRPLTIGSGFVPKRALWAGGTTVTGLDSDGVEIHRRWKDFPADDLYRREVVMFAALCASFKPERPLDISVGADIAASVVFAAYVFGIVAWLRFEGPSVGWALAAALVIGMVVSHVKGMFDRTRLRRLRSAAHGSARSSG